MNPPQHDDPISGGQVAGPHGGEEFPRLELATLVGEAQAQEVRRHHIQVFVLSLGFALLALGLPCARYFRSMDGWSGIVDMAPNPRGLWPILVYTLDYFSSFSLERSAFLVSACLYGVSFWALTRLLRRVGFEPLLCVIGSIVALSCPLAWLGATLPIHFTAGVLGSTLLATELFQTEQKKPYGYLWRTSIFLVLAFLLSTHNIWLLIPAAWAITSQAKNRDTGVLCAFGLCAVFAVCVTVTMGIQTSRFGQFGPIGQVMRDMSLGPGVGSESFGEHLMFWAFALGALWFALYFLFFGKREPEESPPPGWTLPWVMVGIAALAGGGVANGPHGGFLIPIAALGLADVLQRKVAHENLAKACLALACAHALLNVALSIALHSSDPNRTWLETASTHLEPGDVFVTPSAERGYLAGMRLELPSFQGEQGSARPSRAWEHPPFAGKRIVHDGWEMPNPPFPLTLWIAAQAELQRIQISQGGFLLSEGGLTPRPNTPGP